MHQICVIDTETTGLDDTAELVEIGAVVLNEDGVLDYTINHLVKPSIPIPAVASAIHHITDAMVADAPLANDVFQEYCFSYYVAHNAAFDLRFLEHLGGIWICTMKCAYEAWPDAPSYGNQVLSYWLDLPRPPEKAGHAHRALYDAYTTAMIFQRLLVEGMTIDEMVEISSRPRLLRTINFGKWKGTAFKDLDAGYLSWMRKQSDWDEDVTYTLQQMGGR